MTTLISGTGGITFPDASIQSAAASPYTLKNKIINGDFRIDQRNAGAEITPTDGQYTLDRWVCFQSQASKYKFQQNAGSVTPPLGFTNYAGITSLSSYSVLSGDYNIFRQVIEGYNVADLGWGAANAKTITISFWVRSSLTGTFGGSLQNSAQDRNYPFTYTIYSANTWEQKTVTIAGDTSGTWLTTNGYGIILNFGIGIGSTYSGTAGAWSTTTYYSATGATSVVGTNGATFYITGVQLEQNTTATPFERRLYNQELANCQRYYYKIGGTDINEVMANGVFQSATNAEFLVNMPITMRAAPSASYSGTLSNFKVSSNATFTPTTLTFDIFGINTLRASTTVSGATAGYACYLRSSTSTAQTINVSAEL